MDIINFDDYGWGGDLLLAYGYVQGVTRNPTGGASGGPSVDTSTNGDVPTGLPNGVYEGFGRMERTGYKGVHSDMRLADPDGWSLIEVWQGDVFLRLAVVGTTLQVWITDPDGGIDIKIIEVSSAFTLTSYKWFELGWTVSTLGVDNLLNADGSVILRVGQVDIGSASGLRLGYHLPPGSTRDVQWNVIISNPHGRMDMHYLGVSEAVVSSSEFLPTGIAMQTVLAVPGNGTHHELTPLTGTDQGAMVDESTEDGDTSYLFGLQAALKSTLNFADFASIGAKVIKAMKHTASGEKTAPGFRRFRSMMVRGGIDKFASLDHPIGTGYFHWMQHIYLVDPYTTGPLTVSRINSSEIGVLIG